MEGTQTDNYQNRTKELEKYVILDTDREPVFDRITQLASFICNTPMSLITILTDDRQWFKSKVGVDIEGTPIEHAFCNYAIAQKKLLEIHDALQDNRVSKNPYVLGDPYVRFYAGYPLIDQNGFALGTLCVVDQKPRRLTDYQREILRLLAEQTMELIKLRAHKEAYQEFFELVPEMLCAVDSQGVFLRVNPAWESVLGYPIESLIGTSIFTLIHSEDVASTKQAIETLNQGNVITGFVNRYRDSKGEYRTLRWNARSLKGIIYASSKDITQELASQKALMESNQQMELLIELMQRHHDRMKEYTYITSHNLHGAASNILALSNLLAATPHDAQLIAALQETAQKLYDTIGRMNALLDTDITSATTNKKLLNLHYAVQAIISTFFSYRTEKAQIKVEVPSHLLVPAIPAYLDSILYNLISNALKYSRPDVPCQIQIRAYTTGDSVVIEVSDNGIGIDLKRYKHKLFQIGSRLEQSKEGKGIGLFLTFHQVETMGGKIEVESQLGEGSTFRVYLPSTLQ